MTYKTQIREESSPKVEKLAHTMRRSVKKYDVIVAITNGGIIPARLIARELDVNHIQCILVRNKKLYAEDMLPLFEGRKYLVVDDIYDTGDTFNKVYAMVKDFDCDLHFL